MLHIITRKRDARAEQLCLFNKSTHTYSINLDMPRRIAFHVVFLYRVRRNGGFPSGIIRYHWNGTEKTSMAPAQG